MPRFPDLLPEQERALFEIVKILHTHGLEGRGIDVVRERYEGGFRLLLRFEQVREYVDTEFSTLAVLDQAGYVAVTEVSTRSPDLSDWVQCTLTLKKLGSDYYEWCHNPPWYKPIAETWFSLAPDTRSAFVGAVTTFLLGSFALLIRGCLSR